jgi:hypothetical protein
MHTYSFLGYHSRKEPGNLRHSSALMIAFLSSSL